MNKTILTFLLGILALIGQAGILSVPDTTALRPKAVYGKEARVISYILDNNHYRKLKLNDSLSSAILDSYIADLDNNKTYFLASDIQSFDKYRYEIDDLTRNEDVTPAYAIYNLFRKRYYERMEYVKDKLIGQNFDYTIDEYYETNREEAPWAASPAGLDELWRKIIKSQALSLKLTGKSQEEIEAAFTKGMTVS